MLGRIGYFIPVIFGNLGYFIFIYASLIPGTEKHRMLLSHYEKEHANVSIFPACFYPQQARGRQKFVYDHRYSVIQIVKYQPKMEKISPHANKQQIPCI
jgi:hypothetical protein